MRFFFSGEIDSRIADCYRDARRRIELSLNEKLGANSYGNALQLISLIPIILGSEYGNDRKERRLVKHAERTADYRLKIDYNEFSQSDQSQREVMLVRSLLHAIEDLERKLGPSFDGKQIHSDILAIFPQVKNSEQPSPTISGMPSDA